MADKDLFCFKIIAKIDFILVQKAITAYNLSYRNAILLPSLNESGWLATMWQMISGPNLSLSKASDTSAGGRRLGSSAMAVARTSHTSDK
jgi:hypothetical protein